MPNGRSSSLLLLTKKLQLIHSIKKAEPDIQLFLIHHNFSLIFSRLPEGFTGLNRIIGLFQGVNPDFILGNNRMLAGMKIFFKPVLI